MPSALQFTEGHTTAYLYDAAGVKRRVKQVTTTENLLVPMGSTLPVPTDKIAVSTQTDYCSNVIYENGILSRILVDDGYITMSGTTPTYHYYIQDHLGNNRVVFNQNGTIEQTNHYYPFGMTFGEGIDNSDNRYKYNNKELDRMHGLDLYDYGARHYDAAIGRWGVIDPLAEKYYNVSPYAYCMNNPMKYIDPNGMEIYFNSLRYNEFGNPEYYNVSFSELDKKSQEIFYAFASSKVGQKFLQNFIDGKQTFKLDRANSITIKGNGHNYDAVYAFGKGEERIDGNNNVYHVFGENDWNITKTSVLLINKIDIVNQNIYDAAYTFGHEFALHSSNDIDYINKNFRKGSENNLKIEDAIYHPAQDHRNYLEKKNPQYSTFRIFLYYLKGWFGNKMDNAIRKGDEENRNNIE